MAATMPKDLKRETWKKIKPLLMKKTMLGEALEAYGKKRAAIKDKPNIAMYKDLTDELDTLKKAVTAAAVIAKAGKHKDCEESLNKGYTALIAQEAKDISKLWSDYKKLVDEWTKLRVDCISAMKVHAKEMTELVSKIKKTVKTVDTMTTATKTLAPPVIKQAKALVEKDITAIDEMRKIYIATCKSVREAPVTKVHMDDRDEKYLIDLNKVQSTLEGEYTSNHASLTKALKALDELKTPELQKK